MAGYIPEEITSPPLSPSPRREGEGIIL